MTSDETRPTALCRLSRTSLAERLIEPVTIRVKELDADRREVEVVASDFVTATAAVVALFVSVLDATVAAAVAAIVVFFDSF